jgi:hypothetical protein
MAAKIQVPFEKTLHVKADTAKIRDYLANLESHVRPGIPQLLRFERLSEDTFFWQFKEVNYSGKSFGLSFATKVVTGPSSVSLEPVTGQGNAIFRARWEIGPSEVKYSANLQGELPIPSFFASMAQPIIQKEIHKIFENYTRYVEQALS